MQLRELRPQLWLTELVLDIFDVRGAVIGGEERMLVWDTLSHPRDMQGVVELAGGKPIYTAYSHADWDHCWGTAGLTTDIIIAHDACGKRFEVGEVAQELATMRAESPGTYADVQLIPPNRLFSHVMTVDLGGVKVELHPLPGHTDDCLVAFIPQWGLLLAGDTVETPLPFLNASSVPILSSWISKLESWAADTRVRTVVPSHGEIGDRSVITHTIDYLKALRAGTPTNVEGELTPFYAETHAQNVELVRARK